MRRRRCPHSSRSAEEEASARGCGICGDEARPTAVQQEKWGGGRAGVKRRDQTKRGGGGGAGGGGDLQR